MKLLLQSLIERALYIAMLLLVIFNILVFIMLYNFVSDGRRGNIQRQAQMEGYIKCVVLLGYDNPNLGPQSTREEVVVALDRCARKVSD